MTDIEVRIGGVPADSDCLQDDREPTDDKNGVSKLLEDKVVDVLRDIYDPEIPVSIYELGLVYDINVDVANKVVIKMTLTSPACPVAESLPGDVRVRIGHIPEVSECEVELVWEPQWGPDRMSEVAKLKLGML